MISLNFRNFFKDSVFPKVLLCVRFYQQTRDFPVMDVHVAEEEGSSVHHIILIFNI